MATFKAVVKATFNLVVTVDGVNDAQEAYDAIVQRAIPSVCYIKPCWDSFLASNTDIEPRQWGLEIVSLNEVGSFSEPDIPSTAIIYGYEGCP